MTSGRPSSGRAQRQPASRSAAPGRGPGAPVDHGERRRRQRRRRSTRHLPTVVDVPGPAAAASAAVTAAPSGTSTIGHVEPPVAATTAAAVSHKRGDEQHDAGDRPAPVAVEQLAFVSFLQNRRPSAFLAAENFAWFFCSMTIDSPVVASARSAASSSVGQRARTPAMPLEPRLVAARTSRRPPRPCGHGRGRPCRPARRRRRGCRRPSSTRSASPPGSDRRAARRSARPCPARGSRPARFQAIEVEAEQRRAAPSAPTSGGP